MSANFTKSAISGLLYVLHPRLIIQYWLNLRRLPDIAVPRDVNEKMLWRKVFDRNPDFVTFSDKLRAKEYVRQRVPDIAQSPVLWSGTDLQDLPENLTGQHCILKANHSSGMNIVLDIGPVDRRQLVKATRRWLAHRHDRVHGEWGYRNVEPKFFLETDISAGQKADLVDLIVYVFSNSVTLIVATMGEKTARERVALFDADGCRLNAVPVTHRNHARTAVLPDDFDLPLDAATLGRHALVIANGNDHLRVDFMWNGETLYFCEVTVYPGGGYRSYSDPKIVQLMGQNWNLADSWFLRTSQSGWRRRYAAWLRAQLQALQ
ncbi:MAG: hypothetical protein HKP56_04375 [Anderseniella sp.]|nr:hypothetical protein [Anderseniella sp.]